MIRFLVRALLVGLMVMMPGFARAQQPATDMAIGLSGVVDWSVQQPFLDVFKTSRAWVGHKPGEWGGYEYADLNARGLLDPQGWPTDIPRDLRAIGTILLTDLPEEATALSGRYRIWYEGEGLLEVAGRTQNLRYGRNQIEFDFTPGPGGVIINIKRTDPKKNGNYLRNMRVVRVDDLDAYAAGAVFNPAWTKRVRCFGAARFMDWMLTNDSRQSAWKDRPKPSDVTYTRHGVPVEIMVGLANQLGQNPWFNMPHLATDTYIESFATYVRDNLDPDLTAYVEFSNEVWNNQFEQARWAERMALQRWGHQYSGVQYYGYRAAQMADIWRNVFADQREQRLVTVIGTQTGWLGREHDALEAPFWVAEDPAHKRPADSFDAYAVTGYFSALLGHHEKVPMVRQWLRDSRAEAEQAADKLDLTGDKRRAYVEEHRFDLAVKLAAQELRDGSLSGDGRDTLSELFYRTLPYHADIADRYELQMIMYEGGTHVVGVGEFASDDALADFFMHLNYTKEMGELYRELLAGWDDAGGRLFNVFADVYKPNRWGSWGALRHLNDENPRWDALTNGSDRECGVATN